MAKPELLKNVSLFSKLGPDELDIVAAHSEYYDYRKGEVIFEEGGVREELYIIKSGEVVITKRTEGGRTFDVARFVAGDCFGEMSILDRKPRTASAVAAEDSTLLVFPEHDVAFHELLERHPVVFAQILHKLLAIVASRIRTTNTLISERSPWVQALRRRLLSDELTGLYNRTFLDEDFVELLPGYGEETSLLMVKPDNFKAINDTYGHEAGDGVLVLLAAAIGSAIGPKELAVRYRGNEIVVVCPGTHGVAALERAERLREVVAALDISSVIGGESMPISASIGIAVYPRDAQAAKQLVAGAFAAMWKARESGGNRVVSAEAVAP